MSNVKLSVVSPVFNEEDGIIEFARQLRLILDKMKINYEVILVDDGSSDKSLEKMSSIAWKQLKIVSLVSNAGQMAATDAGYRVSCGDYVVTIDSDLQNPVELIPKLLNKAVEENLDVVYAINNNRQNQSFIKRNTAKLYYKTIRFISDVKSETNASDYRLVSKRVVDMIRLLPPGSRMMRLLIAGFNFPSGSMPYTHGQRYAGVTKYSLRSMIKLAVDSILSFSIKPLKIGIYVGLFMSLLSIAGFAYAVLSFLMTNTVHGWTSMMASIFLLFGVLFILLGIIGSYVGRIVEHVNGHPDYIVDVKRSRL